MAVRERAKKPGSCMGTPENRVNRMKSEREIPTHCRKKTTTCTRFVVVLCCLLACSCPAAVAASDVVLSTPGHEFFFPAGDEASIPITLASITGRDIPGTLKLVMVPADPGIPGPGDASVRIREFSAFTEARTVSIPIGRSETPADYLLSVSFSYPDDGGRVARIDGIAIHFVTEPEEPDTTPRPLVGTDTTDPSATSPAGSSAKEKPGGESPDAALQSGQMPQDSSALKEQMLQERNLSLEKETALADIILSDPLIVPLNRSLSGAGYILEKTDVIPDSDVSGRFLLSYRSGRMNADVRGYVEDTRVLFAELSSKSQVPLPPALRENETYREYENRVSGIGFFVDQHVLNFTPGRTSVDLTYSGVGTRILHLRGAIVNGTVTSIAGDDPEDLLSIAAPYLALLCVILLSVGILFLARHRRPVETTLEDSPPAAESKVGPREAAGRLLESAEADAEGGVYPEAYRKTGRALRIILSHEAGIGQEITSDELESLLNSSTGMDERARWVLERSRAVGFAKDTHEESEFRNMIRIARTFLEGP